MELGTVATSFWGFGFVPIVMKMSPDSIEASLLAAEQAVARGDGLKGTGFWKAVGQVKRSPELVDRYADRIAAIDTRAHGNWALFRIPLWVGTTLAASAALIGLVLLFWSVGLGNTAGGLVLLVGMGVLITATHGLAHLAVGQIFGIRFTSWFVGSVQRPQPGVKVDYATYLRTPPNRRAWMHAAGAIVGKIVPFAAIPFALAGDFPWWVMAALLVVGVGQILTDVLWSTKSSDWARFSREMKYAHPS